MSQLHGFVIERPDGASLRTTSSAAHACALCTTSSMSHCKRNWSGLALQSPNSSHHRACSTQHLSRYDETRWAWRITQPPVVSDSARGHRCTKPPTTLRSRGETEAVPAVPAVSVSGRCTALAHSRSCSHRLVLQLAVDRQMLPESPSGVIT
jgi:hypothetical protein